MSKRVTGLIAALAVGLSGIGIVQHFEGVKYVPYRDVGGVLTVCYGHTGPDIVVGKRYTHQECEALLDKDIIKHAAGLDRCVTKAPTKPQAYALTSFAFNVGVSAACNSTLVKHHNAGNHTAAQAQFSRWVLVKGVRYNGLVKRRKSEAALYGQPAAASDVYLKSEFKKGLTK